MDKKKWVGWLLAAVIVVVAAVAMAMGNQPEAQPETQPAQEVETSEHETAMRKLFPEADAGEGGFVLMNQENDQEKAFVYTVNKSGKPIGYVASKTVQGYVNEIDVISGMETSGMLRGVYVGGSLFEETENLGSKVREAAFTDQFKGQSLPLELGRNIDSVAGATISSRAVVDGVNEGLSKLDAVIGGMGAAPEPTTAEHQRISNASVIGYGGPVLVRVGLDMSGAILSLSIGGERFAETEGLGSKVREEAFTSQFIGKTPPVKMDDIDGIAGATVSTEAALEAINEAAAFITQE